jgi:(p)ppGpp synthase/HD superfamily hydrolase
MSRIEKALRTALVAHAGQTDKGGAPYILHPIRVMLRCQTEEEQVVALLHDVAEDSDISVSEITAIFGEDIGRAVACLTKLPGEAYGAYLDRVASNAVARNVKLADMAENSDLSRLNREPTDNDRARLAKYQEATNYLLSKASS